MNRQQRRMAERLEAKRSPEERADAAFHEAAHALVSVRLGLPLERTDIRIRPRALGSMGMISSEGYTTLPEGTVQAWVDQLPDAEARAKLEAFAAQAAAGIVAEISFGRALDDPSHRDDIQGVLQVAGVLGVGESTEEQAVRDFMAAAFARAAETLSDGEDDHTTWRRVAAALGERGTLTGEEVAAIAGTAE